jgi:hypothetical protein
MLPRKRSHPSSLILCRKDFNMAATIPNWLSYVRASGILDEKAGRRRRMIPDCNDDGYLPPGIHRATLDEIADRFGRESELLEVVP